jgi:NAD(P)-dependent dehydrogenase (short-subunit alcohol dehydrogenase family)
MVTPTVLLVTGASSGIGRATALRAAADGDHLALAARGLSALEEAAAECREAGAASVLVVPTDMGDDESVRACVARVLEEHGRVDAAVNAAGVVAYGRTEDVPADVFEGVLRTNLIGSVNLARHLIPVLRRQGDGTLLLVGSLLGHVTIPTMSPYVLSKWGVRALARQLALENRDLPGVRIRYVAPGGVDTPIYDQAANYAGYAGRPPPPAASSDRLAAQVLRRLGCLRRPEQLSVLNHTMIIGFQLVPRVYDALIGAVFPLGATDLTQPVSEGPGNVLESRPEGNRTDGQHGSSVVGLVLNVRARLLPASVRG